MSMKLQEITAALTLEIVTGSDRLDQEVTGGFVSDLLSNVMGQAGTGNVWVTMQGHPNIIAVASLLGLSGIILAGGVKPEEDTVRKAEQEGIAVLKSLQPAFEVTGRLYALGIKGQ
jgi:hypothetical protein